jgi:hypothetical protein
MHSLQYTTMCISSVALIYIIPKTKSLMRFLEETMLQANITKKESFFYASRERL